MKKSRLRRTVTFHEDLYKRLVERSFRRFPNETGGFLLAAPLDNDNEVYTIFDVYHSRTAEGDRSSWSFTTECVVKAHNAASRKDLVVVGIYHSHPWTIVPPGLVYQSHEDADLQQQYNLPISMIVGITNGRFLTSVWKHDYPAPYYQMIEPAGADKPVWLVAHYRRNQGDKFWSKQFGLLPKQEKFGE